MKSPIPSCGLGACDFCFPPIFILSVPWSSRTPSAVESNRSETDRSEADRGTLKRGSCRPGAQRGGNHDDSAVCSGIRLAGSPAPRNPDAGMRCGGRSAGETGRPGAVARRSSLTGVPARRPPPHDPQQSAALRSAGEVMSRENPLPEWSGRGFSRLCGGGWGRGRTGDLPLFRRTLVPTELPSRSGPDGI